MQVVYNFLLTAYRVLTLHTLLQLLVLLLIKITAGHFVRFVRMYPRDAIVGGLMNRLLNRTVTQWLRLLPGKCMNFFSIPAIDKSQL